MGFSLFNDKGEKVDIYLNSPEKKLVMDRTKAHRRFRENSSPARDRGARSTEDDFYQLYR